MPFAIGVLILAIIIAVSLSRNKSTKKKYIIWGITTILVMAPLVSWLAGILVGISVGDGFAGMGVMVYGFAIISVVGFVILFQGIFKKKKINLPNGCNSLLKRVAFSLLK